MIRRERPTARAHREIAAVLKAGDIAVDATAGNGHDTLFLAKSVGPSGRVHAYDIQQAAIDSSRSRVESAGWDNVSFHLASHAVMERHLAPGSAAAVVFNLGYLPGGDHELITAEAETLSALEAALRVLRPGGLLSVICYPGHPGGDTESAAVVRWTAGLPSGFAVEVDRPDDLPVTSPFLILVRRA